MKEFDLKSIKFISIALTICIIFAFLVWNAFKYLPDEETSLVSVNEQELKVNNLQEPYLEDSISYEEPEEEIDENLPITDLEVSNAIDQLEVLDEEELISEENQHNSLENFSSLIQEAKSFQSNKEYKNSISTYEKAVALTESDNEKAKCYEEIAKNYAILKRYGSALTFAQKAYNINPTTNREVLLARLYYKTGNIDKATNRLNNVLRRDFFIEE